MTTKSLLYCSFSSLMLLPVSVSLAQNQTPPTGWVVISAAEYTALRGKAYPAPHQPDGPPVDATLTRADYDLRIHDGIASGQARLTIDVLRDGWVRVPIPSGLMVREARLDGKLVPLVEQGSRGANQLSAVLSKRGRAVLLLDVAVAVSQAGGEEKLLLPASVSGVTGATITLDRQGDLDIRASGGIVAEKKEAAAATKCLSYASGNEPLVITWRRKLEEKAAELPLRLRGTLTELAGLGEDSTSIYAEADLEVLQGSAHQARIRVPANVTVNQVLGANVADWDLRNGELKVTLLEPEPKSIRFTVTGETSLPRDGAVDVPVLRLVDVERESGGLAVEVLGAGEVRDVRPRGLENVEPAELGTVIAGRQSPSLAAFRFRAGPAGEERSLALRMTRYTQQAVLTANVEEARYRALMSTDGKTLIEARYAVRNNQRNFLRIRLPAGAAVWSALMSGKTVHPGLTEDGTLLLPLDKTHAGDDAPASEVEIVYLIHDMQWNEKGRTGISLPALDLPISQTGLELYYPPLFHVSAKPGAFRPEEYRKPASDVLGATARSAPPPGRNGPQPQNDVLQQWNNNASQAVSQALVDRFRARVESRSTAGAIPVKISFPTLGRSLFLVSELTPENQAASVELDYQKDRKGASR